jgi:hypothetical protein
MRINDFYTFLRKRESIRLAKLQGKPFPWTDDPVLREYKFTNVRREHDRTTQELIQRFYSKQGQTSDLRTILFNCALFRYFGTYEFATALGWQDGLNGDHIKKLAAQRLAAGERVFTGAYIITNQGIKAPKEEVVVDMFLTPLWQASKRLTEFMLFTEGNWSDTTNELQKLQGFGGSGFMAKETLLDTMHCAFWPKGLPSDYDTFTPIGPGARRGINRVRGAHIDSPLKFSAMLDIIRELTAAQSDKPASMQPDRNWPEAWGKLAPTDIQFQLCEFDKYERVLHGEGKPRSRYKQRGK